MGLLFSSPLLIFLYILFWVGEHGKPSGATCNSGTRCSCAHFNFIIMGSLFSLPLHFFLVLLVFGSGFFGDMNKEETLSMFIHARKLFPNHVFKMHGAFLL